MDEELVLRNITFRNNEFVKLIDIINGKLNIQEIYIEDNYMSFGNNKGNFMSILYSNISDF